MGYIPRDGRNQEDAVRPLQLSQYGTGILLTLLLSSRIRVLTEIEPDWYVRPLSSVSSLAIYLDPGCSNTVTNSTTSGLALT